MSSSRSLVFRSMASSYAAAPAGGRTPLLGPGACVSSCCLTRAMSSSRSSPAACGLSSRWTIIRSRPCASLTPLYEYQVPFLSMMPCDSAASTSSAVRCTPRPYRISKCASRNGGASLFFTTLTRVSCATGEFLYIADRGHPLRSTAFSPADVAWFRVIGGVRRRCGASRSGGSCAVESARCPSALRARADESVHDPSGVVVAEQNRTEVELDAVVVDGLDANELAAEDGAERERTAVP